MILEDGIPNDYLRTAYWFRLNGHNTFIVDLDVIKSNDGDVRNVTATVSRYDYNYNDRNYEEMLSLVNGQEVKVYHQHNEWYFKINIWAKYYFPTFNEEENQFYHKMSETDNDEIIDLGIILKQAYDIAIKVSGLKLY